MVPRHVYWRATIDGFNFEDLTHGEEAASKRDASNWAPRPAAALPSAMRTQCRIVKDDDGSNWDWPEEAGMLYFFFAEDVSQVANVVRVRGVTWSKVDVSSFADDAFLDSDDGAGGIVNRIELHVEGGDAAKIKRTHDGWDLGTLVLTQEESYDYSGITEALSGFDAAVLPIDLMTVLLEDARASLRELAHALRLKRILFDDDDDGYSSEGEEISDSEDGSEDDASFRLDYAAVREFFTTDAVDDVEMGLIDDMSIGNFMEKSFEAAIENLKSKINPFQSFVVEAFFNGCMAAIKKHPNWEALLNDNASKEQNQTFARKCGDVIAAIDLAEMARDVEMSWEPIFFSDKSADYVQAFLHSVASMQEKRPPQALIKQAEERLSEIIGGGAAGGGKRSREGTQ